MTATFETYTYASFKLLHEKNLSNSLHSRDLIYTMNEFIPFQPYFKSEDFVCFSKIVKGGVSFGDRKILGN